MVTEPSQLEQLILDTLRERGESSAAELSRAARIAPAVLYPALAPLEAAGRVLKVTEAAYPRRVLYSLPK